MKIKTKLTLGVGALFFLIILLSVVGAYNIRDLKKDSENILTANQNTLIYARHMLAALDDPSEIGLKRFDENLKLQEQNITEIGEAEATAELRSHFIAFKSNRSDSSLTIQIRHNLYQIIDLNMQATQRKSEIAKATADKAVFWIAISGTMCLIIAFILLINLPSSIANPIKELTDSISKIAEKKYTERVNFESNSEFGQLAKSFNTMAEKLEEYNQSSLATLMMEKKRIETIINNLYDPVIGLDENLKVIFANEEFIKIACLDRNELIGRQSQEIAIRNDLVRTLIQDLMIGGSETRVKPSPIKIFAGEKESYFEKETLHISIAPTGEERPMLVGHVIFLRNVTSYKELDFAKTNFIATISHEYKTPISAIKMSIQLLENDQIGKLNEEQKGLVESIKGDINRMLKITGELLNISQVESGNIQLSILPVDPMEILNYAINANKTIAEQKGIVIKIECPENLSKALADNEKTAWVLTNLISNAINYSTEKSTIHLKIKQTNNKVLISVKDAGEGIAPQYIDKIFDRYFRVPGTKKEGSGLGLAISKEFMEAQGGLITVESKPGAGSLFTLTLNKAS